MANVINSAALCLLLFTISVIPSPVLNGDRVPSGPSSKLSKRGSPLGNRVMMKWMAQTGQPADNQAAVPIDEKRCLSNNCPTKKPEKNFMNDYYDVNPNVDGRAEKVDSDGQASVIEGGFGAQSRKTKEFEADYVHLGVENLRPTCQGCRVLSIVISDITGGNRKVLSDMKYTYEK